MANAVWMRWVDQPGLKLGDGGHLRHQKLADLAGRNGGQVAEHHTPSPVVRPVAETAGCIIQAAKGRLVGVH